MNERILDYATTRMRRARHWWWIALVAIVFLLYAAGYARLRMHHDLVHDATYYTDGNGARVRTDTIRLGEWRWGWTYQMLNALYWPARACEEQWWRWQK